MHRLETDITDLGGKAKGRRVHCKAACAGKPCQNLLWQAAGMCRLEFIHLTKQHMSPPRGRCIQPEKLPIQDAFGACMETTQAVQSVYT